MSVVFMNSLIERGCGLQHIVFFYTSVNDGPVYPLPNEVINDDLKQLFLKYLELLLCLTSRYFRVSSMTWESF